MDITILSLIYSEHQWRAISVKILITSCIVYEIPICNSKSMTTHGKLTYLLVSKTGNTKLLEKFK